MKRPSPLIQMTMALVALSTLLVILASLFLDVIPDRGAHQRELRKVVGEALAVQLADQLARENPKAVREAMDAFVQRTEGLRTVGIRRADGSLAVATGAHERTWRYVGDGRSRANQIVVPLHADGQRWGHVELAFAVDDTHPVLAVLQEPLVQLLMFIGAAGWLVFGLYMRRALQHLDPSSVVPERVQGAFDAMAEGVVVLDARGRVMLANKAFRALHPDLAQVVTGSPLSSLPWLADALPADAAQHPWHRAMTERSANAGTAIEAGQGDDRRQLVINAAPVNDAGGSARGCMVTFTDQSALHRANEAQRAAMAELEASKQLVLQKNQELETLATRDPMTGALNRRAFHAAFETARAQSQRQGRSIACMMVDIDHFKRINDTHGHGVGDRVIQEVARKLQDSVRGTDLVCRWGGEEFCVAVFGLGAGEAMEFAERVRVRIERECGAAVREVPGLRVTASMGVEMMRAQGDSLSAVVERADQSLYEAKRGGRNRVAMSDAALPSTPVDAPADQIDTASGCLNATGWAAALQRLREATRADGRVLGCLLIGVDQAPLLAARLGVEAVTRASGLVARWSRESASPSAAVARLDDRRVAVLLPGVGVEDCLALGEHLRRRARETLSSGLAGGAPATSANGAEADAGGGQALTVSVGLDVLPASSPGVASIAQRAELARQRAHRGGGDAVVLFSGRPQSDGAPASREQEDGS